MDRRELLEKRNAIAGRLFQVLRNAEDEHKAGKRETNSLTGEERGNYDQMHADMLKFEDQIKAIDDTSQLRTQLADREAALQEHATRAAVAQGTQPGDPGRAGRAISANATESYQREFRDYLRTGFVGPEMRALQATSDIAGGFTIAPEQFEADLIKRVADEVVVRGLASVYTLDKAASIGWPTLTRMGAASWGTELQVAAADSTMSFGKRRLTPHPMTAQILVSKLLPLQSGIPVDSEVLSEFARVRGELEENGFMSGHGAGQPLGIYQASVDGISTGRDITTSSSSGNPTALNLIRTLGSLKPQYRKNATWLIHRDRLFTIRTLQDGNGNFVWLPAGIGFGNGVTAGVADTILGRPYIESEFAANSTASTTGTGTSSTGYYAIVGDFKRGYRIVDAPGLGVRNYDQINAGTNQDTYIGLFQVDGAPVLEEAFARARLST